PFTLASHSISSLTSPRSPRSSLIPYTTLFRSRLNNGVRQAIRILVTARDSMTTDRTRSTNALTALVRSNDLGMDARKALSKTQIAEVAKWRARKEELSLSVARAEATLSGWPKTS